MSELAQRSRLLLLIIVLAALAQACFAVGQNSHAAVTISLDSNKLRPGQPIKGRVSAVLLPSQAPLTNAGINFVIFTDSQSRTSKLSDEIEKLSLTESQAKLASVASSAGKGSGLLLQRLSGRLPFQESSPAVLPLDHNGAIYPRVSEADLSLLESGRFNLLVIGVLSGLDTQGKEVLSYSLSEAEMEVEPNPLKISFLPGFSRPADQAPSAGQPLALTAKFVVEGLPLKGSRRIDLRASVGEKSSDGTAKLEAMTSESTYEIIGQSDGSPVTLPVTFIKTFAKGGDFDVEYIASMSSASVSARESVMLRIAPAKLGPNETVRADLTAYQSPRFRAELKVNDLAISPQDGTAATLPIVVRGANSTGPPLKVFFETVGPDGTLKMNRFLSVVGSGSHSPEDVPIDADGSHLWPLTIRAKSGISPGLYTLPITVKQSDDFESRLLLTMIIRPDGLLPLGVLSQDWLSLPGGGPGDGSGLGGGSVNPVNRGGPPDPNAAFQALIDPGELILRPGGTAGRARLLIQGLNPTSQQPLEVIFIAADQGVLPGGITASPGDVRRPVNQLATTEFEGRSWYLVNLDFTASSTSAEGTYSYEIVVRQNGRGAGTLIISITVDEEGNIRAKRKEEKAHQS